MEVGERDRQDVAFPSYGHDLVVFDQSRRHPLDHGPVDRQMLEVRERDVQLFREGLEELLFRDTAHPDEGGPQEFAGLFLLGESPLELLFGHQPFLD